MNGNEIKANEAARKKRERMNAELNWKFDEVDEWWIAVWLTSWLALINLFIPIPFPLHLISDFIDFKFIPALFICRFELNQFQEMKSNWISGNWNVMNCGLLAAANSWN